MTSTLLRGGTLVTMDPQRRVVRADISVANGRIQRIGQIRRRHTHVVDVRGQVVLPGLVQSHVHLCQTLFRGHADGLALLDWLRQRIWPFEGAHTPRSLRVSAELGIAEMLRSGTTTILDMGTVHHQDVIFETMLARGIRGFSGKAMMDRGQGVPKSLRETTAASLRESHRLCADWNDKDERLGYAYAPRFILSCSERLMRETADAARSQGALVHSHVAEHRDERIAVKQLLGVDDVAALRRFGISGSNVVLAHGVQLRQSEMKRMAKDETRIVHCPSANLKLASGIANVPAMRQAGIVVGIGADGAPCNNRMDLWMELREAALLAKAKTGDATALSAQQALELATIDGARVLGLDHEIGSLEVGKQADVCVVAVDDLAQQPDCDVYGRLIFGGISSMVRHVFVAGRHLVRHGDLVDWDLPRLRAHATREMRGVMSRVR